MPAWRLTDELTLANRRLQWFANLPITLLGVAAKVRWLLVIALLVAASLDLSFGSATDLENLDAWLLLILAGWVSLSGQSQSIRRLRKLPSR